MDIDSDLSGQADYTGTNYALTLSQALSIDIPEADYPRLASLGECRRYLLEKLR